MPLPFKKASQTAQDRNRAWRAMDMGMTLVAEVIAGVAIGWAIDWALDFDKTFVVIGAIGGVLVAMTSFIRSALKENRRLEAERKQKNSK